MLKPIQQARNLPELFQPPSGGCVLKPTIAYACLLFLLPAAFGRLCVETISQIQKFTGIRTSRLRAAVC